MRTTWLNLGVCTGLLLSACGSDSDRPGPIAVAGRGGSSDGGSGGRSGAGGTGSAPAQGGSSTGGGASGSGGASGAPEAGGSGGGASGSGGSGAGPQSECDPTSPEACTADSVCRCCPQAGPATLCLCVVPCSDATDCTDPERTYCDLRSGTGSGMCVEDDQVCCWGCD